MYITTIYLIFIRIVSCILWKQFRLIYVKADELENWSEIEENPV